MDKYFIYAFLIIGIAFIQVILTKEYIQPTLVIVIALLYLILVELNKIVWILNKWRGKK